MAESTPGPAFATASSPSSTEIADFAFVNHDQHTLNNNLPPAVDNKSLARQKRRRTSPEDAEILEYEYTKNPRPSSSEQSRIASRVSLEKKAIATWFQNRRKKDRVNTSSEEELSSDPLEAEPQPETRVEDETCSASDETASHELSDVEVQYPWKETEASRVTPETEVASKAPPSLVRSATWSSSTSRPSSAAEPFLISSNWSSSITPEQSTGYLANRLASSQQRLEEEAKAPSDAAESGPYVTPTIEQTRTFARSRSFRISTDENGNASIVERDVSSPAASPTIGTPASMGSSTRRNMSVDFSRASSTLSLGGDVTASANFRYYNAINGGGSFVSGSQPVSQSPILPDAAATTSASQPAPHAPRPRMPPGQSRSRDSRLWESCADKSAGQELSRLAESESSGSAKDAIEAMRSAASSSQTSSFGLGRRRRVMGVVSGNGDAKRGLLKRAGTYAGRVGTAFSSMVGDVNGVRADAEGLKKFKKPALKRSSSEAFEIYIDGESDKENRDPIEFSRRLHGGAIMRQEAQVSRSGRRDGEASERQRSVKSVQQAAAADGETATDSGDETTRAIAESLMWLKSGAGSSAGPWR